jgi:hypothetical protein
MSKEIKNQKLCTQGRESQGCNLSCSTCNEDLSYRLSLNVESGIGIDEFVEHMKETDIGPVGACAICGKNYVYGGFNPHPIIKDKDARCCARCYCEKIKEARDEADCSIINESKGRMPKDTLSLHKNPNIIVNHVKRVDTMRVVSALKNHLDSETIYDFVDAEYQAPFFIFKQAGTDEVVKIDRRKITSSNFAANNVLLICVDDEYGPWRFYPYDDALDNFIFNPHVRRAFESHKIADCLLQAARLEGFANNALDISEDSNSRVYVRFRTGQKLEDGENPSDTCGYCFEIIVGTYNDTGFVTCADGIFLPLENSEDIIKTLAHGLMQKLLSVKA